MSEGKLHFNRKAYENGHRRVFGQKPLPKGGRYVMRGGRLVLHDPTAPVPAELRCKDNVNIRSIASGINPDQKAEFERKFGHLGVKYHPVTGDAYYKDRAAKLRVLKARGYHDSDEVRG